MELGYETEELGYEEGYAGARPCLPTSKNHIFAQSNIPVNSYQCQEAGGPSILRRNSPVPVPQKILSNPSKGTQNQGQANGPGLSPQNPAIPPVPPARILDVVGGGPKVASSQNVPGNAPGIPAPVSNKDAQHLTGQQDPNQSVIVPRGSEAFSLGSYRLEKELRTELKKKFGDDALVNDYMKRFDKFEAGPKRDKMMRYFLDNRVWEKEGSSTPEKSQPKPVQAAPVSVATAKDSPEVKQLNSMINNLPPPQRAKAEELRLEGSRNILFYTLTGKQFDPSRPVKIPQSVKTIDPPLTREEALAYMQSKGLTDAEGNPKKEVSAASFINDAFSVQDGKLDRKSIVAWERQEIVKTLSGPPYKMKGPEIVRLMNSKGWLGENPNIAMMETFLQRAVEKKDVLAIQSEVKATNVKGNDPMGVEERDRADAILDNLGPKKKGKEAAQAAQTREARANRELQKSEGALNRESSWKQAKMKEDGDTRRHQENLKAQKEENDKKRAFDEKQAALQRKHDSEQKAKDRKSQMMITLIQFIGQMMSGAMSAMAQVGAGVVQGQQQMAGQVIASMRGGRGA